MKMRTGTEGVTVATYSETLPWVGVGVGLLLVFPFQDIVPMNALCM